MQGGENLYALIKLVLEKEHGLFISIFSPEYIVVEPMQCSLVLEPFSATRGAHRRPPKEAEVFSCGQIASRGAAGPRLSIAYPQAIPKV